jgi:hypothetical protein
MILSGIQRLKSLDACLRRHDGIVSKQRVARMQRLVIRGSLYFISLHRDYDAVTFDVNDYSRE